MKTICPKWQTVQVMIRLYQKVKSDLGLHSVAIANDPDDLLLAFELKKKKIVRRS